LFSEVYVVNAISDFENGKNAEDENLNRAITASTILIIRLSK
jgi:hypothetical protein